MSRIDRRPLPRLFAGLFLSLLSYLALSLLDAGGQVQPISFIPAFLSLRLLLSLSVWLLSVTAFCSLELLLRLSGRNCAFPVTFSSAFLPTLAFSCLAAAGLRLQVLHAFVFCFDLAISFLSLLALLYIREKAHASVRFRSLLSLWFLFPISALLSGGALFLFSPSPLIPVSLRILLFLLLVLWTSATLSSRSAESPQDAAARHRLTDRETEVLSLLSRGYSDDETAHSLGIPLSAVRSCLSSILLKTGTRNRDEIVTLCERS